MNDNDWMAIMIDVHTNSAYGNEAFLEGQLIECGRGDLN